MGVVSNLVVRVQASTADFNKEIAAMAAPVDGFGKALAGLGGALAGAFAVNEIVGMAHEIGQFAGRMQDLSAQTGIGVERLQALNYVAATVGTTVDDIATAVSQLSKRLVSGQDGAVNAVERLGLSASALIDMKPDQAFIALAEGIQTIPNPMEQARLAMELFGRSGARLLPLLKEDLRNLTDEAMKNGAVISAELIAKADRLDDAWNQLIIRGKALLATVLIPAADIMSSNATSQWSLAGMVDQWLPISPEATREMAAQVAKMKAAVGSPMGSGAQGMPALTMSATELQHATENLNSDVRESIRVNQAAADAQEKWNKPIREGSTYLLYLATQAGVATPAIQNLSGAIDASLPNLLDVATLMEKVPHALYAWPPMLENANTSLRTFTLTAGETIRTNLGNVLEGIPQRLVQAFTGGGGFVGAMKAIGVQVADVFVEAMMKRLALTKLGEKIAGFFNPSGSGSILGGGVGGGGVGGSVSGAMSKWGGALAGASTGLSVGLATGSKTFGVLAGAGSGAAFGAMLGGPLGAGIGAAVGGIAGFIGGLLGHHKKPPAAPPTVTGPVDQMARFRAATNAAGGGGSVNVYINGVLDRESVRDVFRTHIIPLTKQALMLNTDGLGEAHAFAMDGR